jgi:hypothetical protein
MASVGPIAVKGALAGTIAKLAGFTTKLLLLPLRLRAPSVTLTVTRPASLYLIGNTALPSTKVRVGVALPPLRILTVPVDGLSKPVLSVIFLLPAVCVRIGSLDGSVINSEAVIAKPVEENTMLPSTSLSRKRQRRYRYPWLQGLRSKRVKIQLLHYPQVNRYRSLNHHRLWHQRDYR